MKLKKSPTFKCRWCGIIKKDLIEIIDHEYECKRKIEAHFARQRPSESEILSSDTCKRNK
mgnify:CR=1 FL=1